MKKLLLLLTLIFAPLNALIIESDDIRSILNHVYDTHHHKEILVVLDIDNTIAHVAHGFGGDEWFGAMLNDHVSRGINFKTAVAEILPLYTRIQETIWLDPVQPETVQLIKFLQEIGVAVIALTARSTSLLERTIEQLKHLGIDLALNPLTQDDLDFTLTNPAYLRNGILFCGQNNKGELLTKFFEAINYHPSKVIFVDDKQRYIEQVDAVMDGSNTDYVGIRYSHLDEKVKNFCLEDHTDQLHQFSSEHF